MNQTFRQTVILVLALGSAPALASSRWDRVDLMLYPRCRGGAPLSVQSVAQEFTLHFESPIYSSGQYTRRMPLDGRRLSVVDGTVFLSGVPREGERVQWTAIGRIDPSSIHCHWRSDVVSLQFVAGQSATLHVMPHGECQDQRGDIPFIGDFLSKTADYRLEFATEGAPAPIVLETASSDLYETLWECVRARGDRVTTLR